MLNANSAAAQSSALKRPLCTDLRLLQSLPYPPSPTFCALAELPLGVSLAQAWGQGSNFLWLVKSWQSNKPSQPGPCSRAGFQFRQYLAWWVCTARAFHSKHNTLSDVSETALRGWVFGLNYNIFMHLDWTVYLLSSLTISINYHLPATKKPPLDLLSAALFLMMTNRPMTRLMHIHLKISNHLQYLLHLLWMQIVDFTTARACALTLNTCLQKWLWKI